MNDIDESSVTFEIKNNSIVKRKILSCRFLIPTPKLITTQIQPNIYLAMKTDVSLKDLKVRDSWTFEKLWSTKPTEPCKLQEKIIPKQHRLFNNSHCFPEAPCITDDFALCRLKDDLETFFTNEFQKMAEDENNINEHPWLNDFIEKDMFFNATVINYYQDFEYINWHADIGTWGPIVSLTFFDKSQAQRIFTIKDHQGNIVKINTYDGLLMIMAGDKFQTTLNHCLEKPKFNDDYRLINITCHILVDQSKRI